MVCIGNQTISWRKTTLILFDLVAVVVSMWFALILRFDGLPPEPYLSLAYSHWSYVALTAAIVFLTFQFYDQIWRYAGLRQYAVIVAGVSVQIILLILIMLIHGHIFPRSFYIIYGMLTFFSVFSVRVGIRILDRMARRSHTDNRLLQQIMGPREKPESDIVRVMVIGAGEAGSQLIRDMQHHVPDKKPVVVIDDNPAVRWMRVLGVPVHGDRSMIPAAVEKYAVDLIVLALPSAPRSEIRAIIEIAQSTSCQVRIVPFLNELINGQVSLADAKEVEIEDLLGRDEIKLDMDSIAHYLRDEVVLVTGGGGSIGSELCRQIARFGPKQLIVFDIYENNAYQLQYELKGQHGANLDLKILIGSVRDPARLEKIFTDYRPSVVFHAAAHKHVPLMEDSPGEAVKNNIFGTFNVARQAAQCGVRKFVLISTDKAVRPTNVMGATKRICELLIQNLNRRYPGTNFVAVRFGNVLGSNGSVIPLFRQQIKNEKKVTVTHPEITRYFMTIPEAARLVIQAGAMAQGGEIFVLDMGEPVKILDLARELIRLSGYKPDIDIKIEFTGLRPGEKMYEELSLSHEPLNPTPHEKIMVLNPVSDSSLLWPEIETLTGIIGNSKDRIISLMIDLISDRNFDDSGCPPKRRQEDQAQSLNRIEDQLTNSSSTDTPILEQQTTDDLNIIVNPLTVRR